MSTPPPPPFFSPCSPAPAPNYRVQSRCLINDSLINGCPITGSDTSTLLMVENQFPVRGGGVPHSNRVPPDPPPPSPPKASERVCGAQNPLMLPGVQVGTPHLFQQLGWGGGSPVPGAGGGGRKMTLTQYQVEEVPEQQAEEQGAHRPHDARGGGSPMGLTGAPTLRGRRASRRL